MRLHNGIGSTLSIHFLEADIRGKFLAALTFLSFFATLFVHSSNGQERAAPTALEIHRWTKQLADDDWILQSVAMEHLGNWKIKQAIPEIRQIFEKGKSSWLRGQAMLTLAKIQGKKMIPTAQRTTKEKDPVMRRAALQALDLVGGKTSAPVARELLKDPDMSVRATAAALYASQFPEEAWPTVERLTPPDKAEISSDLMRGLALVGSEESFARLETLFHAPQGNKRRGRKVIQALAAADKEGIPLLVRLTVQYGLNQAEFQLGQKLLGRRDKADLHIPLKETLLAKETRFQASAASLMAKVCPTKELGDLLADSWIKRKEVPQEAIREGLVALSKIDPLRYQEFFSHYLRSEDSETRAMAVRCRGLIPDKNLFEAFRSYVHDENAAVAQAAIESLRRAPFDARPKEGLLAYLKESFRSSEESVQLAALDLLGKRGMSEDFDAAIAVLKPFLEEGEVLKRERAATALAELSRNERVADIAVAQGFLSHWKIVGPFLNDNRNTGFGKVYGPEQEENAPSYKAEYRWEFGGGQAKDKELDLAWGEGRAQTVEGEMHVAAHMPVPIRHAVAYAKTTIHSNGERSVRLAIEVRERASQKVWVNDQVVADFTFQHNELGGTPADRMKKGGPRSTKTVNVALKNGSNRVMVKTATFGGSWWLQIRVLDAKKNEMAEGVRLLTSPNKGT